MAKDVPLPRLGGDQIESRLAACPRLPSLGSISSVLQELLNAEECYASQVADVIRRDPSLTTRLLRLINSVYYNPSTPIGSIDEAVFFMGVCQIRRLAVITPLIDDLEKLTGQTRIHWPEFWRHCISTGIVTSEILGDTQTDPDDSSYVAGLLHDVGKVVMAAAFPEYFKEIQSRLREDGADLLKTEMATLGMDHCELGARYLSDHKLPASTIQVVRFHHQPKLAPADRRVVAAVQVADLFVRCARLGNSGNPAKVTGMDWRNAEGWELLFPNAAERANARANADRSLASTLAKLKVQT